MKSCSSTGMDLLKSLVYKTPTPLVEDLFARISVPAGRICDVPGIFQKSFAKAEMSALVSWKRANIEENFVHCRMSRPLQHQMIRMLIISKLQRRDLNSNELAVLIDLLILEFGSRL
ncbi:hypothetical protein TNCV_2542241 [Trichonephila clavipes]|nr:hypothetical protein TNCV_2542241 [Trichonephila clavipes]